jgi:Transposase DDE domain group 1
MNLVIQIGRKEAYDEEAQQILNSLTLPVMEYARSSGLFSLMDTGLHLKMKAVKYSWQDKLRELMCSIVAGCEHTVSINHRLVPDTTLAKELIGKDRFADQSGINRLLHAFGEENLKELESVYQQDYTLNGRAWRLPSDKPVIVDLDMTGFRVQGTTYEGAQKGYIERARKGAKGYKASFAYVHSEREILGCVIDGGKAVESTHIDRIVELVKMRLGSTSLRRIILRGDPKYGTSRIVDRCLENKYLFLFKGANSTSARKYAKRIERWEKIVDKEDEEIHAGELRAKLPGSKYRTRIVVFRSVSKKNKEEASSEERKKRKEFWHLVTNLHESLYTAKRLLELYHEREGMEAYIKTDKSGLHLKNLRTRNLTGIRAFLLLTCMAHNLIVHAIRSMKNVVKGRLMGVKAFVEKLACAKAWFVRKGEVLMLLFTEENPVIKQYLRYARGPTLLDYT